MILKPLGRVTYRAEGGQQTFEKGNPIFKRLAAKVGNQISNPIEDPMQRRRLLKPFTWHLRIKDFV